MQIIEFSILFLILNYPKITTQKLEDLSNIVFLGEKNESLKKLIINTLAEGSDKDKMISKINSDKRCQQYEKKGEQIGIERVGPAPRVGSVRNKSLGPGRS